MDIIFCAEVSGVRVETLTAIVAKVIDRLKANVLCYLSMCGNR